MKKTSLLLLFALLIFVQPTFAQTDAKRIQKDIEYLSHDKLQGRYPGTKQELVAANYIIQSFKKSGIAPKGTQGYLQAFPLKSSTNPHASDSDMTSVGTAHNVIGYLDNQAKYTIVIGAHYDHLGLGLAGNSLDPNPKNKIHNGADDNASGTAGVMELARIFSQNNYTENVNFLFICFSAEEEGLLGSKYFTNNPTINLNSITCMLNMDMIGRLNDSTKKIVLSGVGTSPMFGNVLSNVVASISYKADSAGMGPSDHASFYLKDIPVLHFYTGTHYDYHKPSDDANKINAQGEVAVIDFVASIAKQIAKYPEKLTFRETKNNISTGTSTFKVTLGVIPDYAFDGDGLRLDGVSEGKPASKAGLKTGDIIVKMGPLAIHNIQDYMKGLGMFSKGEVVTISILRAKEQLNIAVTF